MLPLGFGVHFCLVLGLFGFFFANNFNRTYLSAVPPFCPSNLDMHLQISTKSERVVSWCLVSGNYIPKRKASSWSDQHHNWGQIGITQLFNVLLDIFLADQCTHIAPDLTDHLPSCKLRVQQERAGAYEENKGCVRSPLTEKSLLTQVLPILQRNSKTFSVSHQAKPAQVRRPCMPLHMYISSLL